MFLIKFIFNNIYPYKTIVNLTLQTFLTLYTTIFFLKGWHLYSLSESTATKEKEEEDAWPAVHHQGQSNSPGGRSKIYGQFQAKIYLNYGPFETGFWCGWLTDLVSFQTTDPILTIFGMRITFWSGKWLHVLFFKNLKSGSTAHKSFIFSFATDLWRTFALTSHEPNLMSLGIETTFWSWKWVQESFFKSLKKWQRCTKIFTFQRSPSVSHFPWTELNNLY